MFQVDGTVHMKAWQQVSPGEGREQKLLGLARKGVVRRESGLVITKSFGISQAQLQTWSDTLCDLRQVTLPSEPPFSLLLVPAS